jgi:predicted glycoside hydrolase/deacetylase ChbG (UPF0249 family)
LKIILHADDLGISARVNEAIFSLMDERKLTSASILANGPAFAEAVRLVPSYPDCSFGVHLNITEFAPLTAGLGAEPFLGAKKRRQRFASRSSFHEAIFEEWTLQVQRVRAAGVRISHVDSHHHTHTRLSLYKVLAKLCREQQIQRVRIRQTFTVRAAGSRWRLDNRLYNWRLRRRFSCVDEFGALAAFSPHRLDPEATVEIMVHPGNPRYEGETELLRSSIDEEFCRQHQCITYRDVP